ncbi:MAG TPA: RluA family pseudouridine synthase [Hyphomicrobiaceae bacterium]|nr:RluA family pseudouridine synthase [Hyphomicrobiaceae bacterium]
MSQGAVSHTVMIADEQAGLRLDRALAAALPDLSRQRLQALMRAGAVRRAGRTIDDPSARVKPGDVYTIDVPEPEAATPEAESIALDIRYEDDHLIVIDKPAGLVVHPGAGHASGTLVNALIAHCGTSLSGIGGVKRPGIVHRLDKDTSGLMVVAKSDASHRGLQEQFASHGADGLLTRAYLALVWGQPLRPSGVIDASLQRSRADRTRIAVTTSEEARHAVTHFKVIERYVDAKGKPLASLLRLELETGRTHQIRVHLAHISHPVMGDPVYGAGYKASAGRLTQAARAALEALGRQALHATHLGFEHPISGKSISLDSALPVDIARLRDLLRMPD